MKQYLSHFADGASKFVDGLGTAAQAWETYVAANTQQQPGVTWSAAYFLNAINCTLISTRLFLEGYIVASGNQARQSVESLALGVLLPFPRTGACRDWSAGKNIEHTALERLARNAEHCGAKRQSVQELRQQAKWFDRYSHPSRLALASAWAPESEDGWSLGAVFIEQNLKEYRKEMTNRISMTRLLANTMAGTHRELLARGFFEKGNG
jgi:hypothetical protein